MLEFYSSSTGTVNSKRAMAECLEKALEDQTSLDCDLIVFFTSIGHNFNDLLSEAHRLSPGAEVVGCTGSGVIGREGPNESMKALAIMAIKGEKGDFAVVSRNRLTSSTSFEVVAEMAHELKNKNTDINMILFLPSGIDALEDMALEGMESVFGPDIPICGATSGDNLKSVSNFQFVGDKIIEMGAVAVGFADSTLEIITQATHGFNIMGDPFTVTRSELNRIYEFDGQPAFNFIADKFGITEDSKPEEIMPALWLARELPEALHEEYGNTHILFNIQRLEADGSLMVPVLCEDETRLWNVVRDERRMFEDTEKMLKKIVERCKGRIPVAVFHADCALRGRFSLNRILKDEIVHCIQYPLVQDRKVPWLGLYGFGEFAQIGGRNKFHQMTTSLFVLLKKE